MAWTTPFTFTAGFQPTATKWNEQIRDNLNIILTAGAAAWADFTPTWTGSVTNPAIVDGTNNGAYIQIGKLVVFSHGLTCGPNTTYGSGTYAWALPVTAEAAGRSGGTCNIYDSNVTTQYQALSDFNTTTTFRVGTGGTTQTYATPTSPITWANGDILTGNGFYEAA